MERVPETADVPIICSKFLENSHGGDKSKCPDIHTKYPFLWQAKVEDQWCDFTEQACLQLESKYSDPQTDGVNVNFPSCILSGLPLVPISNNFIDFDEMIMFTENGSIKVRRLSTVSTAVAVGPYSTNYHWFFEAWDDVWVRYGETLESSDGTSSQIRSTSSDDIEREYTVNKKLSISTQCLEHKYELNLLEMTQTNKETKVVRRIRRRVQAGPLKPVLTSDLRSSTSPASTDKAGSSTETRSPGLLNSNSNHEVIASTQRLEGAMMYLVATFEKMRTYEKKQHVTSSSLKASVNNDKATEGSGMASLTLSDTGFPSSNCSYEWYFEDDDGTLMKYGGTTPTGDSIKSNEVEVEYQKNPISRLIFKLNNYSYEIDFKSMTQTNTSTGKVRNVHRILAGSFPLPVTKNYSTCNYEWYFQDDDLSWVKYGSKYVQTQTISTNEVEEQYIRNPKTPFQFKLANCSYILDFTKMTQTNNNTKKTRNVCRTAIGSPLPSGKNIQVQSNSQPNLFETRTMQRLNHVAKRRARAPPSANSLGIFMPNSSSLSQSADCNSKVYSSVSLNASHSEYNHCIKILGLLQKKPSQVFKISNPYFKTAFENRKAFLQKQNPGVTYKEMCLFHGTKSANVPSILEDYIDWRLHGTNSGQAFGRGTYFSNSTKISCNYGQALFICKVLVGLTSLGNTSIVRPPKDGNNRPIDTTVNNVTNPSIFVKYCSEEYYPEYYVLF